MTSNYVFLSVYIYHSVGFTLPPTPTRLFRNIGIPIQKFTGAQMFL